MKIKDLKNGKVRITPDDGKILMCSLDGKPHSEAVVERDKIGFFYEKGTK